MVRSLFFRLVTAFALLHGVGGFGCFILAERFAALPLPSSITVNDIHEDRYGFWWLASGQGLHRFEGYRTVSVAEQPALRQMTAVGEEDFLAVGAGGAWLYRQATQQLRPLTAPSPAEGRLPGDVQAVFGDGHGRAWFAGGDSFQLIQYNHADGRLRFFSPQSDAGGLVPWRRVFGMALHGETGLWMATDRGLFYLSFATDRLVPVVAGESLPHGYEAVLQLGAGQAVTHVALMENQHLLVASRQELLLVSPGMESPVHLAKADDFHQDRDSLEPDAQADAFSFVRDTLLDEQSRLWFAGDAGLWMLAGTTAESSELPPKRWRHGRFTRFFRDRLGTLWVVGRDHGVLRITPDAELGKVAPPVLVTALQLNYQPVAVEPDRPEAPLRQPPFRQSEVHVPYDQNNVGLGFTGLDFARLSDMRYRFKLEGLTPDWIELEPGRHNLMFTNLAPGAYRLRLQASDVAGRWLDGGHAFEVQVAAPWFASTWALAGYGSFGLTLLLLLGFWLWRRDRGLRQAARHDRGELQKQKQSMEKERKALRAMEHRVKDLQQRLEKNQDDLRGMQRRLVAAEAESADFLLQVNHQLRDAFAMTLDGLAQIRQGRVDLPQQLEPAFADVERGVGEAWQRVDLLLDRSAAPVLPPAVHEPFRFDLLIDDFVRVFRVRCERLGLGFAVETERAPLVLVGDAVLLRRTLLQLLEFALRHEHTDTVDLVTEAEPPRVQIAVGYREGAVGDVFDDLLRARIDAMVDAMGAHATWFDGDGGPVITLDLPFARADMAAVEAAPDLAPAVLDQPSRPSELAPSAPDDDRPLVLVVAGSGTFRRYLSHKIKDPYRVMEAGDYASALAMMRRHVPDLMLCDGGLASPDGREDLVELKNADPALSHIAVVMLTATAGEAHQIHQREQGGVVCLIKPFQTHELLSLLARHLDARRQAIKAHQRRLGLGGEDAGAAEPEADDELACREEDAVLLAQMTDLIHQVDAHEQPLDAEAIAAALGLTPRQLERKVEALLGLDLADLIRDERLKLACALLAEDEPVMNHIAVRCGYASLREFAQAFREVYAMTPTEYLNQHRSRVGSESSV